jgi:hypothetical protein
MAEIIVAGREEDWEGLKTLLRHWGDPKEGKGFAQHIAIVKMLASDYPPAWDYAIGWLGQHGSPREVVWACRWILTRKIGVENVIRAWRADGMSYRQMAELLGPGYSKSTLQRMESQMNAAVAESMKAEIRLEGEKTRAEVRELGNLIVGSVIAREGSPAEAAEEILAQDEGSSVS